jgi:chromosome segregation ATPase
MERDLAIQTFCDEKNSFATKRATLEAERAKLSGESAELRVQVKSLTFELDSLKDSLTRAREEAETLRREKVEFTVKSREASLAADYKRLGLVFDAKSESVVTILGADEIAFQAFRSTLSLANCPFFSDKLQ